MKIFRYIACGVAVLVMVGCSLNEAALEPSQRPGEGDVTPGVTPGLRPTVPLKKRPIVPSTKLPRPRCVDVSMNAEGGMVVTLGEDVGVATITVVEHEGAAASIYMVDSDVFVLNDIPESAFDIVVEVDGVVETYSVME